jgi:hypothetical protein
MYLQHKEHRAGVSQTWQKQQGQGRLLCIQKLHNIPIMSRHHMLIAVATDVA